MASVQVRIVVKKNDLPGAPGKLAKAIGEAFQQLAPELLSTMQEATPVDTGELRGSENASAGAKELRLTAGTDHGKFVEFGTRKMAAQPFMRPTVEGASGAVASAITDAASGAFG
ncbi:MAG: HK97-gp10 family putative phage morphogenesis protein [Dehalococcoidia bacterium]